MPQYDGTEVLTIGKADQAKRAAEAWFQEWFSWSDTPAMYKPGHEGPMWVLSLKGGPDDWTVRIAGGGSIPGAQWPAGVLAEPVNSWCLGLYPDTEPPAKTEGERLARDWEVATEKGWVAAQERAGAAMARYLRGES